MTLSWVICSLLLLSVGIDGNASFLNQVENYINLVSAYNYDGEYSTVDVIPLEDVSRVMEVNVDLSLFAINGFDEVAGKMDLVVAMNMSWVDESPLITSTKFSVVDRESFLVPYDKIWTPKLVLKNAVGETTEVGGNSYLCSFNMKTYRVTWKPRVVISGACTPDVTYYPFDKQVCSFTYTGWDVLASEMLLASTSNEWDTTNYEPNGEWNIVKTSTEAAILDKQSIITFTIEVSRKPLYFAFNIIMPVLILCCLNSVVFLLPAESGERVGFSITCFLSFMVILNMVMEIMPRSSSPISYLCFYLVIMMCNSGAMTLVTILLMRVYFKPEKENVPKWISRTVTFINCGCARLKCCVLLCRCLRNNICECQKPIKRCMTCCRAPRASVPSHEPLVSDKSTGNSVQSQLQISEHTTSKLHLICCKTILSDRKTRKNCDEDKIINGSIVAQERQVVTTSPNKLKDLTSKTKSKSVTESNPSSTLLHITSENVNTPSSDRGMENQNLKTNARAHLTSADFLQENFLLQSILNDEADVPKEGDEKEQGCRIFPFSDKRKPRAAGTFAYEINNDANTLAKQHVEESSTKNETATHISNQTCTNLSKTETLEEHLGKKCKTDDSHSEDNVDSKYQFNNYESNIVLKERVLPENDPVECVSTFTDSYDETENSLDEDVHWSEVGRVLDIFFFLGFLGAQIFFTVVFFVPIATN